MEPRTIFHKILAKELPATVLHDDAEVQVIKDIHPQAPLHLLFIPKTFVESLGHLDAKTAHLPAMLIEKARNFAAEKGIADYKLMFHVGKYAVVPYLHLHFLSDSAIT